MILLEEQRCRKYNSTVCQLSTVRLDHGMQEPPIDNIGGVCITAVTGMLIRLCVCIMLWSAYSPTVLLDHPPFLPTTCSKPAWCLSRTFSSANSSATAVVPPIFLSPLSSSVTWLHTLMLLLTMMICQVTWPFHNVLVLCNFYFNMLLLYAVCTGGGCVTVKALHLNPMAAVNGGSTLLFLILDEVLFLLHIIFCTKQC